MLLKAYEGPYRCRTCSMTVPDIMLCGLPYFKPTDALCVRKIQEEENEVRDSRCKDQEVERTHG